MRFKKVKNINLRSIKIHENTYNILKNTKNKTKISIPRLINYVVGDEKENTCAICGLLPAFHVFIFDHTYKKQK